MDDRRRPRGGTTWTKGGTVSTSLRTSDEKWRAHYSWCAVTHGTFTVPPPQARPCTIHRSWPDGQMGRSRSAWRIGRLSWLVCPPRRDARGEHPPGPAQACEAPAAAVFAGGGFQISLAPQETCKNLLLVRLPGRHPYPRPAAFESSLKQSHATPHQGERQPTSPSDGGPGAVLPAPGRPHGRPENDVRKSTRRLRHLTRSATIWPADVLLLPRRGGRGRGHTGGLTCRLATDSSPCAAGPHARESSWTHRQTILRRRSFTSTKKSQNSTPPCRSGTLRRRPDLFMDSYGSPAPAERVIYAPMHHHLGHHVRLLRGRAWSRVWPAPLGLHPEGRGLADMVEDGDMPAAQAGLRGQDHGQRSQLRGPDRGRKINPRLKAPCSPARAQGRRLHSILPVSGQTPANQCPRPS